MDGFVLFRSAFIFFYSILVVALCWVTGRGGEGCFRRWKRPAAAYTYELFRKRWKKDPAGKNDDDGDEDG